MKFNSSGQEEDSAQMLPRRRPRLTLPIVCLAALLLGCSGALPNGTAVPTVNVPNINSTSQAPTLVRPTDAQPLPTSVSSWEALGLSGRVLYTPSLLDLRHLDLTTGQVAQVFQGPPNSWLSFAAPSPDGSQIVVAYSPPPEPGKVQLGFTSLYSLPGDCAQQAAGCTADQLTPDGQSVLFSAVDTAPAAAGSRLWSWLDQLQGVKLAEAAPPAHSVPSDWWQVSVNGGPPVRLTKIYDTGLFGDFSPDGKWLGYISRSGFYIMAPDGSDLTRLRNDSLTGTMNWIP